MVEKLLNDLKSYENTLIALNELDARDVIVSCRAKSIERTQSLNCYLSTECLQKVFDLVREEIKKTKGEIERQLGEL